MHRQRKRLILESKSFERKFLISIIYRPVVSEVFKEEKPSKKRKPKVSQWEIRKQIADKKREQIIAEVRRKREREEEQRQKAEHK